jgi:molybdopterin molybdotransferase
MVDGFAVRAADLAGATAEHPVELRVVATIPAGDPGERTVGPGEAARIMTGAPLPPGADAVVMLEWTSWSEDRVRVERETDAGAAVRRPGEDVDRGEIVLEAGRTLGPAALGVLASVGCARPAVYPRPQVAVLVTGDELLGIDEPLAPGRIRSSNDWTLAGLVREAGGIALELGIAPDDEDELASRIAAGGTADVLLTSGGVSVGDRDRVPAILEAAGFEKIFWRVMASPGKPLLFGRLGKTLVFGLPGNPVSSMVAFENFVRPTLRRLQGDPRPERDRMRARVRGELAGPEDRRHFARVIWSRGRRGPVVREVGPHGSGNLRSMARANGLAVLPEGVARRDEGDEVEVMVLGRPEPEEDSPGSERER